MFIELVDALRCPRPHEESWLVLASTHTEARHIRDGTLGCPVCHAEYPIRDGVADFRDAAVVAESHAATNRGGSTVPTLVASEQLAAMLGLADPHGFAVLVGRWGSHADALLELIDAPPLLLADPPGDVPMRPGLSGVRCGPELPLAAGAARAVAVDTPDAAHVESAARATRVGGRLVAPAEARVPAGVRELARDDVVWVGERETAQSGLVTLHVRRARQE